MFKGKTINLLPMNPTEIVNSEKTKAPGNIDEDNVHALLAFNSPIHGFNVPSDERVTSGHHNLDCKHEVSTISIDAQLKYKYLLVSHERGTYITRYGCLFGSALFSWLTNFQAMESRGRLCFQDWEDDETITCVDTTKSIGHIYNCQVISRCNTLIIDCIIGGKTTTHAYVFCRTVEDMETLHNACWCMSKDLSIYAWLSHVTKLKKRSKDMPCTDQSDAYQQERHTMHVAERNMHAHASGGQQIPTAQRPFCLRQRLGYGNISSGCNPRVSRNYRPGTEAAAHALTTPINSWL
jgi:hypothetical protein